MQSTVPANLNISRADTTFFESLLQSGGGRAVVTVSATLFVAACAHITLPLPFTPVPLTLSDFAVILVGLILGPSSAFFALLLYLAEGAMGLPVFNPQGPGGFLQLTGPTAGYLVAYPFAAALAGMASKYARRNMSHFSSAVIAGTLATITILSLGAVWLAHLYDRSFSESWAMAVAPFLYGAAAKVMAAAGIYAASRPWLRS
jgi:biotin transport system substrate-specific component